MSRFIDLLNIVFAQTTRMQRKDELPTIWFDCGDTRFTLLVRRYLSNSHSAVPDSMRQQI
jgi:hypothetical protein